MWSPLVLLLVVGTALGLNGPWEPNKEYRYRIHSRTYTGIPELRQQYAAVVSRGQLIVQTGKAGDANVLIGQLQNFEHAGYNGDVPDVTTDAIPEYGLRYQPSNLNGKPFQVYLAQGTVQRLEVDKSLTNDEVNQLKGILSQLQANTQGHNLVNWVHTQLPQSQNGVASGLYRTMEASVTGQCETIYEISPVADYAVPNAFPHFEQSQLPPQGKPAFQIVKTANYSNCVQVRGYHYGVSSWNVHSNKVGQFMSRNMVNRIVAFGTPADFTIYYSQSNMQVLAAPELYQKQKSVTTSTVELYLTETSQYQNPLPSPNQPQNVGNLVYRYNIPSDRTNAIRAGADKWDAPNSYQSGLNQDNDDSSLEESSEQKRNYDYYSKTGRPSYAQTMRSLQNAQKYDNFWQPAPVMDRPAENPFLPYFVGHRGHAIRYEVNMASEMQVQASEIARQTQNHDNIPQQHTLEKFNILVDLIASANYNDIVAAAKALSSGSQANNNMYPGAWKVFRDAAVLGGNGPTTLALTEWISSGQLNDDDAIAALLIQPKVVNTPTKEHFDAYFNLIKNQQVVSRPQVYSATLLTLSEIAGHAYSNYWYARNYYPEDSFGPFGPYLVDKIENQLIPYINQSLKTAVESNNDRDFLIYIRAYGNLEHPSYLSVFKQYYERKEPLSAFQRSAMIMAMNYLTVRHREQVGPILYKIYMNVAEDPDVRSVAVLLLIGSNPPNTVLQQIASFTNEDPSIQVQSVVKHTIETFANLQSPEDKQRAANAKSALQFLNPRSYGNGYSHSLIHDEVLKNLNYNRHRHISILTSNDSPVPSMVRITVFDSLGGITRPNLYSSASVSNVVDLLKRFRWPEASQANPNYGAHVVVTNITTQNNENDGLPQIPLPPQVMNLAEQFQNIMFNQEFSPAPEADSVNTHNPFKPAELNLDVPKNERIQGQSQHWFFGGNRYNAYDEKSINNLPRFLNSVLQDYQNGREINFSKFYKEDTITIAFPLPSGYPYVFSWDSPTLIQMNGKVTVKTSQPLSDGKSSAMYIPQAVNVSSHGHILYSRNHITQAGFVTPFSGKHYVTGHVRRVMYNLPIYFDVNVDLIHHSINGALMPVGKAVLGHFSSVPYTAEKDAFSTAPDTANQPGMRVIHTRQPKHVQRQLGKDTTGLVVSITGEYETPRDIYGPIPYLVGGLPKSGLMDAFLQPSEGLEHYNIQVSYSDLKTKTDGMRFGFTMKSGVIRKTNKDYVNSQQEYLQSRNRKSSQVYNAPVYASSGIPHQGIAFLQPIDKLFDLITPPMTNGKATVVSAYVAFAGPGTQTVYEAVGAYSSSRPNGLIRVTGGFRRNELNYFNEKQYCFEVNVKEPGNRYYATSSFEEAIKADREIGMQFRFTVGPDCVLGEQHPNNTELVGIAVMNQTADYEQFVLSKQVAQQCKQDASHSNSQSPACRQTISELRVPNSLSFHVEQTGSSLYVPDLLKIFAWTQKNPIVKNTILSQREIKQSSGRFVLSPDTKYYDGTFKYGNGQYQVHDLEVSPFVRSVAFDEQIYDQLPYKNVFPRNSVCVVDRNQIDTFDGNLYNQSIGGCSYTLAQTYEANYNSDLPQESSSHVRDVTIMMSGRSGSPFEREASIQFYTDKQGTAYTLHLYGSGINKRPAVVLWRNEAKTVVHPYQHLEVVADGVVRLHVHPQTSTQDNVIVADLHDGSMRVVFNGAWIRIEADSSYRNKLRGLCGTNDLEMYTDQQSPRHCMYHDLKHFINSWVNPEELALCHANIKQSVADAQNAQCYPIQYLPNVVVNQYEGGNQGQPGYGQQYNQDYPGYGQQYNQEHPGYGQQYNQVRIHDFSRDNYQATPTSCQLRDQIQYVDSRGQVCFSTVPLAACPQNCQSGNSKRHTVSVRCYNRNDPRVRAHIQAINKGQTTLNWGSNAVQRTLDFQVPSSCRSY